MKFLLVLLLAWGLDRWLGEPKQGHPLVAYGRLVSWLETRCYGDSRLRGVLALGLVLLPVLPVGYLEQWLQGSVWYWPVAVVLVYLAMGYRSLQQHALAVFVPLEHGDFTDARQKLSYIVSRDVSDLPPEEISKATVETVLENGNDAVFAPWFWFVVAGLPGVVLYRLANTLDAMWGYKNPRYLQFGWAAARLDDLLNWLPARLTALAYCLAEDFIGGRRCWRQQAKAWKSPNAGPVMAAGAGSLRLKLGGAACYHGELQQRPPLGWGREPEIDDIPRTNRFLMRSAWWFLVLLWPLAWYLR